MNKKIKTKRGDKRMKDVRKGLNLNRGSGRVKSVIILSILASLFLVVCYLLLAPIPIPPTSNDAGSIGMPNPSAVYCKALGYQYRIVETKDGGQIGVCVFPDGKECKAWDFFAGRAGREHTYCEKIGGKVITERCPYANECAVCLFSNGTKIPEVELIGVDKIISGKK